MTLELNPLDRALAGLKTNRVPVVIGRADDVDLKITNRFASRRHCLIDLENGSLVLRDLGSRHGTYVNGEQVDEVRLLPGDEIQIGLDRILVTLESVDLLSSEDDQQASLQSDSRFF